MIDFDGDAKYARSLIERKTIPSSADLTLVVRHLASQDKTLSEINDILKGFEWGASMDKLPHENLITVAYTARNETGLSGSWSFVKLYASEIQKLAEIDDDQVRRLLYLGVIIQKWNNHPSGWIRFDRQSFFEFWGWGKWSNTEKSELLQKCHNYGFDMRVVGSKNPIVCFNVNFVDASDTEAPAACIRDAESITAIYNDLFGGLE